MTCPPTSWKTGAEIRRLLKLPDKLQKFTLTYSPGRGVEGELAVNSRSMLQIMYTFASYLDVPEADLKAHRALPGYENASTEGGQQMPHIYSGKDK